jgi:hypothetical protein
MQKESEQRSTYFWIARLPEAQSLPLTSRKSACPPAALKLNYTCCRAGRKGIASADIRRVHVKVCFSGKSGHEFMSTRPTWGRDYGKTVHRQDWHDLRRRNLPICAPWRHRARTSVAQPKGLRKPQPARAAHRKIPHRSPDLPIVFPAGVAGKIALQKVCDFIGVVAWDHAVTISLKRSTQKSSSYPQAAGRLPHLSGQQQTSPQLKWPMAFGPAFASRHTRKGIDRLSEYLQHFVGKLGANENVRDCRNKRDVRLVDPAD